MTVKVYLSQSLIASENRPCIVDGKLLMEGYEGIPLSFDAMIGQYLEIDWHLFSYQEKFDLVSDIKKHVVMITLFQDDYLDSCYVDGKYTSNLGTVRIVRTDKYSGKVFMQADSFDSFIKLVKAYKEGDLVLENTDKTPFQILSQRNEELSEKLKKIENSLCYKLWLSPQTIKDVITQILNKVRARAYVGHDM